MDVSTKIQKLMQKMGIPANLPLGQDAVISGSFMWHVLTQDLDGTQDLDTASWLPHDLDVFLTKSAVPRFREFLVKNNFRLCYVENFRSTTDNIVEEWAVPGSPEWSPIKDQEHAPDFFSRESQALGLPDYPAETLYGKKAFLSENDGIFRVQLIVSPNEKPFSHNFDLPTLENTWDGQNLYVPYAEHLKNRVSTVRYPDTDVLRDRVKRRIQKYKGYGLNILE
jgi:hypothetical protein